MIKGPLFLGSSILGVKCSNLTDNAHGAFGAHGIVF